MITQYTAFWLALAVVGVTNGVARELTYGRVLPELRAHQLSTVLAILLCGMAVLAFSRFFPIATARDASFIGLIWLGLTVAFEFGFGRLVAGHSWSRLFADYNLLAGRVWLLFLAWMVLLPYVVYRVRAGAV